MMRYSRIILVLILAVSSCKEDTRVPYEPFKRIIDRNYEFSNGVMPRNVLESYLSRSITQCEFLMPDKYLEITNRYREDDVRMLKNIGAKFIGRSIYSFNTNTFANFNQPDFWEYAKSKTEEMHDFDPDVIFQGGIFEIVTDKCSTIPVPAWVFEAFDLPVETRNFEYEKMLNRGGRYQNYWGPNQSVPDITQLETRLFFYFTAVKFMQVGVESLHFGQAELISMSSKENNENAWVELLGKIREAASTETRRGMVICDAHLPEGGFVVDGKLLFDFVAFTLVPKENLDVPQNCMLEKYRCNWALYGRTKGGITPSGWSCDKALLKVEFDNFGISDHPGIAKDCDCVWGYDEITWFSRQPEKYRNEFLKYANAWIENNDPNCFLEMPGNRITTGGRTQFYRANTASEACPYGYNQEETIKEIWSE